MQVRINQKYIMKLSELHEQILYTSPASRWFGDIERFATMLAYSHVPQYVDVLRCTDLPHDQRDYLLGLNRIVDHLQDDTNPESHKLVMIAKSLISAAFAAQESGNPFDDDSTSMN